MEKVSPLFIFTHGLCSVAGNDGRARVNKPTVHFLSLRMDCAPSHATTEGPESTNRPSTFFARGLLTCLRPKETQVHCLSLHMDCDPSPTMTASPESTNRPSCFYLYTWIVDLSATAGKHPSTVYLYTLILLRRRQRRQAPSQHTDRPLFIFTHGLLTFLRPKENARPLFIFTHGLCSVADNDGRLRINKPTVHLLSVHMDC